MSIIKKKKEMRTSLNMIGYKDKNRCIALCLEFDLVAEGATHREAKDNLTDLIASYLRFAMERDLEQFAYHPAPKIYWDKFKEIYRKRIPSPQPFDTVLLKASKNRIKGFMREAKTKETPIHA